MQACLDEATTDNLAPAEAMAAPGSGTYDDRLDVTGEQIPLMSAAGATNYWQRDPEHNDLLETGAHSQVVSPTGLPGRAASARSRECTPSTGAGGDRPKRASVGCPRAAVPLPTEVVVDDVQVARLVIALRILADARSKVC